ncbi:MAG: hypothetical protein GY722_15195 [bacterium]|nr:hypothetical protein [bacterium]
MRRGAQSIEEGGEPAKAGAEPGRGRPLCELLRSARATVADAGRTVGPRALAVAVSPTVGVATVGVATVGVPAVGVSAARVAAAVGVGVAAAAVADGVAREGVVNELELQRAGRVRLDLPV